MRSGLIFVELIALTVGNCGPTPALRAAPEPTHLMVDRIPKIKPGFRLIGPFRDAVCVVEYRAACGGPWWIVGCPAHVDWGMGLYSERQLLEFYFSIPNQPNQSKWY